MKRKRLQEVLKGLAKCVGIALGILGLQVLEAIAILAAIGLLVGWVIRHIPPFP